MNYKEYLLGLLDGSHTLSNEGIGLVLERMAALERVAEATKRLRSGLEITNHHIRRDGTVEIRLANITDNQSVIEAMDALAALEEKE